MHRMFSGRSFYNALSSGEAVKGVNNPIFLLLLLLSAFFVFPAFSQSAAPVDSIRLSFVGDLMSHGSQIESARSSDGMYDYRPGFRLVKDILQKADIAMGNFETVLAGPGVPYQGYPTFNTPDAYLDALIDAGFDILSLSNNHILDHRKAGLLRTIEKMDSSAMPYFGAYKSKADRGEVRTLDVRSTKISFLGYTYATNVSPNPADDYEVAYVDHNIIKAETEAARKNCDLLIVCFHYGNEYERLPNSSQRKAVEAAVAGGADIIIGGHPHVLQPIDYFKTTGGTLDTGFVIYSMGNFLSGQTYPYTDESCILSLTIERDTTAHTCRLAEVEAVPTIVRKISDGTRYCNTVIPSSALNPNSEKELNIPAHKTRFSGAVRNIIESLTAFSKRISIIPIRN